MNKPKLEDIDWAEIPDRHERRKLQNRLAQRKVRKFSNLTSSRVSISKLLLSGQRAKEAQDNEERNSRNLEYAENIYRLTIPSDIDATQEPPGLPWGSVDMRYVIAKGYEAESQRSSGKELSGEHNGVTMGHYDTIEHSWTRTINYGNGDVYLYELTDGLHQ